MRELERERHVWEISHDFVARQLGQILPRLRPSWLRRARSTLAPAALVAWLMLLPLVAFAAPEVMSWYAQKVLAEADVSTPWDKDLQGYRVDFSQASAGAFGRLRGYLEWLHPVRALVLARDQEARDLPPFPKLEELRSLTIEGNGALEALPDLAGLGALTELRIWRNPALEALDLAGLGALTELTIEGNAALEALDLAGLGALTQLSIMGNTALEALPELAGLTQLQEVRLAGSFLPKALSQLRALPNLRRAMLSNYKGVRAEARSVNAERARNGQAAIEFRFERAGVVAWSQPWDAWDDPPIEVYTPPRKVSAE